MRRALITALFLCASAFAQQGILAPILQGTPAAGGVTWTMVQHPSTHLASSGTSVSVTTTATTAGNLFFFIYLNNNTCNAAASITETGGSDAWTAVGGTWTSSKSCAYYVLSGTGGVTAVSSGTITSGGADAVFFEVHRSTGTASLDGTPIATFNGGASTAFDSGAITTTGSSDILIGYTGDFSGSGKTLAPTTLTTIQTENDGFIGWTIIGLDSLNVAAGTYHNNGTTGTSDSMTAGIIAFK